MHKFVFHQFENSASASVALIMSRPQRNNHSTIPGFYGGPTNNDDQDSNEGTANNSQISRISVATTIDISSDPPTPEPLTPPMPATPPISTTPPLPPTNEWQQRINAAIRESIRTNEEEEIMRRAPPHRFDGFDGDSVGLNRCSNCRTWYNPRELVESVCPPCRTPIEEDEEN